MKPYKFVFTVDITGLTLIEAERINRLDFLSKIKELAGREVCVEFICYEARP